jgi:hypothetical protein
MCRNYGKTTFIREGDYRGIDLPLMRALPDFASIERATGSIQAKCLFADLRSQHTREIQPQHRCDPFVKSSVAVFCFAKSAFYRVV